MGQSLGSCAPYLEAYLLKDKRRFTHDDEPLFRSRVKAKASANMTTHAVQIILRRLNDHCGFGRVPFGGNRTIALATPHALRRSRATHMRTKGVPIEIIQSLLGHSNINTTIKYLKHERGTVAATAAETDL